MTEFLYQKFDLFDRSPIESFNPGAGGLGDGVRVRKGGGHLVPAEHAGGGDEAAHEQRIHDCAREVARRACATTSRATQLTEQLTQ